MKNNDEKCFLWSVTRAVNSTKKNPQRVDKKLREQSVKINLDGISFPVGENDMKKFEEICN